MRHPKSSLYFRCLIYSFNPSSYVVNFIGPQFSVHYNQFMLHYENMPMQYTETFKVVKNENFQYKNFDIFLIFAQNIDCGYTLEPPRRGSSNEYPQSMFWSKNEKNRYTPAYPSLAI